MNQRALLLGSVIIAAAATAGARAVDSDAPIARSAPAAPLKAVNSAAVVVRARERRTLELGAPRASTPRPR